MKWFKEQKAYLVFTLIMSVFISILSGCGGGSNPASATNGVSVKSATVNTTPIDLGAAAPFAVFGGSAGMTNQGIFTVINGDVATTGASLLITGFHDKGATVFTETSLNMGTVNGAIYSATAPSGSNPGVAAAAVALAAQNAFDSLSPAALPGGIDVSSLGGGAGELGNRTLSPGIYKSAPGTFSLQGGDLTLDAGGDPNAVFVFQMATSLTVGGPGAAFPQSVILVNGAQAKNVFWQVGSTATINAAGGGTMVGTIISSAATTFSTAGNATITTLDGRALALNASVTMVNTHINAPSSAVVLSSAKAITAYSVNGVAGTVNETAKTISVTMPYGTNATALAAKFTTTGAEIKVGAVAQMSGTTANNFTSPVAYTVTAADSTTATYNVTVTVASGGFAKGPAAVNLGTAGNFVILAKTGVSTTGTTAVVGDIGVSPVAASYITGFSLIADSTNTFSTSSVVTGKLYAADYAPPTPAVMTTAVSDMQTAFTDAAGRTSPDYTELYAGDITGQTLVPGLYKWGTGVLISGGGVTLTGGANDVWIFQIAQDLTVSNSAIITLAGGAQAKNIFWQVSGQANLGTAADFKGIILSQTLISLNTGAKMTGRALAQTAVTLNATTITAP